MPTVTPTIDGERDAHDRGVHRRIDHERSGVAGHGGPQAGQPAMTIGAANRNEASADACSVLDEEEGQHDRDDGPRNQLHRKRCSGQSTLGDLGREGAGLGTEHRSGDRAWPQLRLSSREKGRNVCRPRARGRDDRLLQRTPTPSLDDRHHLASRMTRSRHWQPVASPAFPEERVTSRVSPACPVRSTNAVLRPSAAPCPATRCTATYAAAPTGIGSQKLIRR